jgi:hypothetical protein
MEIRTPHAAGEYAVTWTVKITSTDPVSAAREAYEMLRTVEKRPTRFEVVWNHPGCELRYAHPVELGRENPLGRSEATFDNDAVFCPHCGSDNTRYVEDLGQYGPLFVRNGHPAAWSGDLEQDEVGEDPRVLCLGCGVESKLPASFDWA